MTHTGDIVINGGEIVNNFPTDDNNVTQKKFLETRFFLCLTNFNSKLLHTDGI